MAAKRKPNPETLVVAKTQFQLSDARILKQDCERFVRPEDAPKGTFKISQNAMIGLREKQGEKGVSQRIVLVLKCELTGSAIGSGEKKTKTKSFRVNAEIEYSFVVVSGEIDKKVGLLPEDVHGLIREAHPHLMIRVRGMATEMGFPGVRPRLGIPSGVFPKIEDPTDLTIPSEYEGRV